jgi:hypothetical protein
MGQVGVSVLLLSYEMRTEEFENLPGCVRLLVLQLAKLKLSQSIKQMAGINPGRRVSVMPKDQ